MARLGIDVAGITIAQIVATMVLLLMLLVATPFWHSTPTGAATTPTPVSPVGDIAAQYLP